MGWFKVLKYSAIVTLDTLQAQFEEFDLDLQSPSSKGYPESIDSGVFVVEYDDETHRPYGYTTMKDMGKFVFVGNSYMASEAPRGSWKKVVSLRDSNNNKLSVNDEWYTGNPKFLVVLIILTISS